MWLAVLLTLGAVPVRAQEVETGYGDWIFGADDELAAASTTNEAGASLGIVCSPNCVAYIASDVPCRPDSPYAGTMESSAGNHQVRFTCRLIEGRFALLTTPTEELIDATAQAEELTFRVILNDGTTAFRFSLRGAFQAIYAALERAMALARASTT